MPLPVAAGPTPPGPAQRRLGQNQSAETLNAFADHATWFDRRDARWPPVIRIPESCPSAGPGGCATGRAGGRARARWHARSDRGPARHGTAASCLEGDDTGVTLEKAYGGPPIQAAERGVGGNARHGAGMSFPVRSEPRRWMRSAMILAINGQGPVGDRNRFDLELAAKGGTMDLEMVADYRCVVGEGPLWHEAEQRLYWVDIVTGRLFRYDPATGGTSRSTPARVVGGFTVQADGALLLFMARGAVKTWRDGAAHDGHRGDPRRARLPLQRRHRRSRRAASSAARCRREQRPGRLYRLDPDRTLTRLLEASTSRTGWASRPIAARCTTPSRPRRKIYRFDYDQATGALTNQPSLSRRRRRRGLPDGMTVDAEGYVWSARWDGGALTATRPDGDDRPANRLPGQKVSSITFGGPDYADAYVTTAGGETAPRKAEAPAACSASVPACAGNRPTSRGSG